MCTPSSASTSDSFGVHAVIAAKPDERVARVDQHERRRLDAATAASARRQLAGVISAVP